MVSGTTSPTGATNGTGSLQVNGASVGSMSRPPRRTAIADVVSTRDVVVGAVVALGALVFTTGPLYRIRSWWAFDDPLAADVAVVLVQLVFGLLGAFAIASSGRWKRIDRRLAGVAAVLVAWTAVTALWSADAGTTLRESAMIVVTLLAGIGAAVAVGERTLVFAGWIGVHAGLAWSAVSIVIVQPGTQDKAGDWTGVYFNPNSLALVAAIGVLLSVILGAQHWHDTRRGPVVAVLGAAAVADLWLIRGAGSLTPLAALLVGLAVAAGAVAGRRVVGPGGRWERDARHVTVAVGVVIVAVSAVAYLTRSAWLGAFGRSTTLTGRTQIWDVAFEWWWDQPIRGQGYLGAWSDAAFTAEQLAARGEVLDSTHNSFVELLLGAGIVGLVLAVALFTSLWIGAGTRALTGRTAAAAWPLAVLVFVIVENLAETLWVGGQIAVVLTGVLMVVSVRSDATDRCGTAAPDLGAESADEPAPSAVGALGRSDDRVPDDRIAEVVRDEPDR